MTALSITRLFGTSRSIFNRLNSYNYFISKACYCDKKQIIVDKALKAKLNKKTSVDSAAESCEEIEARAFENEEQILQTVILEKEKDANVRSRLSKECNKLVDRKIAFSSTGLNLHLEEKSTKNTCWEDYGFDKTVDNLKKHTLATAVEVKSAQKDISSKGGTCNGQPPVASKDRIVRGEPGKVLFAFVPEEWFKFFIPKTGVCGFGTFLFTFGTFLVSKEYYVLEHNYYNGLGVVCVLWAAITYVGPHLAKYLDKEIDDYEKAWERGRNNTKTVLGEQIEHEKLLQFQAEGQLMLMAAKRENVHLQLEEEFRLRQMTVYREVLKRLNYQIVVAGIYKRFFHRNLVDYVTKEVRKALTPDMEKDIVNVSIDHLLKELEKSDNKR